MEALSERLHASGDFRRAYISDTRINSVFARGRALLVSDDDKPPLSR